MIKEIIEDLLEIKKYKSKLFDSWKDNITYEIITDSWDNFIVQEILWKKTKKNLLFIDEVTSFINNNNKIIFAEKYKQNRFIIHKWKLYQLMKKINWKTIHEKDINISIIKNTAKYIASFHNEINNFDCSNYEEINYYKKMHSYRLEIEKLIINNTSIKINDIFSKMNIIAINLIENKKLPKWIIHWDPSFKNYLINEKQNIVWLIDYDMLSVNNYLWDLADLIRSYMKSEVFNRKEFEILINSYNSVRKLSDLENKELKNYCKMMILDTWFRYLLNSFEVSNQKNLLWDKNDSISKAERCLWEIKKLEGFYS